MIPKVISRASFSDLYLCAVALVFALSASFYFMETFTRCGKYLVVRYSTKDTVKQATHRIRFTKNPSSIIIPVFFYLFLAIVYGTPSGFDKALRFLPFGFWDSTLSFLVRFLPF